MVIIGADPLTSNGSLCTAPDFPGRIEAIRERGGTVVVPDFYDGLAVRPSDGTLFATVSGPNAGPIVTLDPDTGIAITIETAMSR